MSTSAPDEDPRAGEPELDADEYGGLSVEDEPGTVNPADLAGTASDDDDPVGYQPVHEESDEHQG